MPLDADGYPDEESLEKIRDINTPAIEVFRLVIENWKYGATWGYAKHDPRRPPEYEDHKGKQILRLGTGGWSGNEEVLAALHSNFLMGRFFVLGTRGGLDIYEVPDEMAAQLQAETGGGA